MTKYPGGFTIRLDNYCARFVCSNCKKDRPADSFLKKYDQVRHIFYLDGICHFCKKPESAFPREVHGFQVIGQINGKSVVWREREKNEKKEVVLFGPPVDISKMQFRVLNGVHLPQPKFNREKKFDGLFGDTNLFESKELTMNIQKIDIDSLRENPVQPKGRITETAIKGLVETILDSNFIAPIVVCGNIIVDGHRRWMAAKKIGRERFPEIDCIYVDSKLATPTVWFIWLNRSTRNVGGADWFSVWAHSTGAAVGTRTGSLKKMPSKTQSEITDMVAIFGLTRAIELGREGKQSPNASKYIRKAFNALREFKFVEGTDPQLTRVGEWVLHHKQTLAIKRHIEGKGHVRRDVERLFNAIQADRPLEEAKSKKLFRKRATRTTV